MTMAATPSWDDERRPIPRGRTTTLTPTRPARPARPRRSTVPATPATVTPLRPRTRTRPVPIAQAAPEFIRITSLVSLLLVLGVVITMIVSGQTTKQSFQLDQLRSNEQLLNYQIDTLNRNVRNADSAAEIARRAGEMGMVIPDQPGVLQVGPDGTVTEIREADPSKTRPLVDVNGERIRPLAPTSNPADTNAVTGQVVPAPQPAPGAGANVAPLPAAEPYEARATR